MSLKDRLSKSKHKLIEQVTIDGERINLCRPTNPERLAVLDAAREAGEIGEDNKPLTNEGGLRLIARVVAAVAYDPETGERVFNPTDSADIETVYRAPWLEDVSKPAIAALHPNLEEVRGNS
ncbi:hypothetical protein FJV41_22150 [Myxococcus llanfairpwllgwyngyllgogerychwyrndrobwllllantysiliogogogochensis]|uniref:Phage protein n=1 Tax=Myxococcus llanfairpwllgwyngyllgogerychwyrndrobwllllantysiliogogogochensis TaxID=2590453 RepID=A0A540WXM4_9BACT|nr:hypothetical protein [Myxococcus llanfairpwllgwyngyllgogerychwyrndrobwllllantysiliogogogochensis]TQF13751.1 hypothetical protein FJV41_22150 [Myxococcus llanfairpwllgwyngyllgogerychwyrndrobwllllantysiliogogogochensis]